MSERFEEWPDSVMRADKRGASASTRNSHKAAQRLPVSGMWLASAKTNARGVGN